MSLLQKVLLFPVKFYPFDIFTRATTPGSSLVVYSCPLKKSRVSYGNYRHFSEFSAGVAVEAAVMGQSAGQSRRDKTPRQWESYTGIRTYV